MALKKKETKPKKKNTKKKVKEEKKYTNKDLIKMSILSTLVGIFFCLSMIYIIFGKKIIYFFELKKITETYSTIRTNYYGKIDKNKIIDNAINSMIEGIDDDFTTYTDNEETETFLESVQGTYEGIGCMVSTTEEGKIVIVTVFKNSPSSEAGLKEKDIILKVDNKEFENSTDVSNYIRNEAKTKIKIKILRDEEEKEVTVIRKKVEVPVVSSQLIEEDNHKIGYIRITTFTSVSDSQFKTELKELEKEKIEALIIDVRDNGGGYLSSATNITSMFLKKGQPIYQLEINKKKEIIKDETKDKRTYPIAVIINESSASASEILASAIKESYSYKGLVTGVKSYGKGTVQQTKKLSDGSMIKYTTQKWLTPDGNYIDKKGVEPTNEIERNYELKEDNQLTETTKLIIENLPKDK